MDNSLLAVRDINHKYIVVERNNTIIICDDCVCVKMNNEIERCAVVFTYPIISHVNPILALVDELREKKFKVVVFSTNKFKSIIELHDASYIGYGDKAERAIEDFVRGCGDIKDMFRFATACEEMTEMYMEKINCLNPDIIIHDTMSLIGKQISEITGIVSVSVCTSFAVKKTTMGIPYVSRKVAMNIYLTRFADWIRFKLKNKRYSRKYGIESAKVSNLYFNFEGLNIVCALRWMQPHNNMFGEDFKFVGELVCENQGVSSNIDLLKSEKKLLYISFGSLLAADRQFYQKCIELFGDSEFNVVMNIGKYRDVNSFGKLPENIYISNYLPQIDILKKADVFITHGGMNSVTEAIRYGVPMIMIPLSGDEPSVARALVEKQIGILLEKDGFSYDTLRERVQELMEDEKYKYNCRLFKDEYIKAGGSETAVIEISKYLETKS